MELERIWKDLIALQRMGAKTGAVVVWTRLRFAWKMAIKTVCVYEVTMHRIGVCILYLYIITTITIMAVSLLLDVKELNQSRSESTVHTAKCLWNTFGPR